MGHRLARLRALKSLSVKEVANLSGLSYGDLIALEGGAKQQVSMEHGQRLADLFHTTLEYLASGEAPGPGSIRAGYLRAYDSFGPAEQQRLKFAPIQSRVEALVRFMEEAYPGVLDRAQVAARLGYTPKALEDVLRGSAPLHSPLLKHLAALTGLGQEFFVRGDFFGGAAIVEEGVSPERLSLYYEVVKVAIAAGVSAETLRKAVDILAIRD